MKQENGYMPHISQGECVVECLISAILHECQMSNYVQTSLNNAKGRYELSRSY